MKPIALTLVIAALCSCGAAPKAVRFVNRTPQSDAFLMEQWQYAQAQVVDGGEDLAAIRTLFQHTPPEILPGDPRGWSIEPHGLLIDSAPDAKPWLVHCPAPCDVSYAVAYSLWGVSVVYAESWNQDPKSLAKFLQYEFVSQILYQLHYDVSWR